MVILLKALHLQNLEKSTHDYQEVLIVLVHCTRAPNSTKVTSLGKRKRKFEIPKHSKLIKLNLASQSLERCPGTSKQKKTLQIQLATFARLWLTFWTSNMNLYSIISTTEVVIRQERSTQKIHDPWNKLWITTNPQIHRFLIF